MAQRAGTHLLQHVRRNYPLRIAIYYLVMGGVGIAGWRLLPPLTQQSASDVLTNLMSQAGEAARGTSPSMLPAAAADQPPRALEAAIAALGALVLALPAAWVYMYTRQRRGYRQSMVHSLVLLPVVVAGIVVLVKNSLALAFGLAAIVGAVRFRNNLDDSRDTVFILAATGLGLASAVQMDVAVVASILFNVVVLGLFYTDFARTPPSLEGVRAQRQMERALATANRTSQFVAQVDRQILENLAPEQLDALAERLRRRREEVGEDLPSPLLRDFDRRLRIHTTDADALRDQIEPVLDQRVKRWRHTGTSEEASGTVVEYAVKLKKGMSPGALTTTIRGEGTPYVVDVEIL
ncbi:MAG: DUF4956 domain-containing protein [Gemmatimonadota bacterium]